MAARRRTPRPITAELVLDDWKVARTLVADVDGWVFRGHRRIDWHLETSFDRNSRNLQGLSDRRRQFHEREKTVLREFRRRVHHFVPESPTEVTELEWLALIQHHGGPTRLLDFTSSFYAAVFFALEQADPVPTTAVIWAVNRRQLNEGAARQLGLLPAYDWYYDPQRVFDTAVREDQKVPAAVCVEPRRMNVRLAAQQGVFVAPLAIQETLLANLAGSLACDVLQIETAVPAEPEQGWPETPVVKMVLPARMHLAALRDLQRMNITAATLFTDLDGLARSQAWHLL